MKTTTVTLWLRAENNSKFVRGKKRSRENIENYHLRRYGMKKLHECEHELTFSCHDDTDLDQQFTICFRRSKWKRTRATVLPKLMCKRKAQIGRGEGWLLN